MSKAQPLSVEVLWQIERVGAPALAPDGQHAVCTVTAYSMDKNQASTSLWLLQEPGQGHAVTGQVFEVDDTALAAMDVLEQIDEPGWYRRERISVRPAQGGEAIEVWVYFGTAARAATERRHFGPLAEYTAELARTYRDGA